VCALFGPRIGIHTLALELEPHVWPEPLAVPITVQASPMLAATVHTGALAETKATVQQAELGTMPVASRGADLRMGVLSHAVKLPPLAVSGRREADVELKTRARLVSMVPPVRLHDGLEAMRARKVERRGVPARLLTEAQAAYWRKRLGDAKRVPLKLIDLVMIFPDVPIVGEQPVHYVNGALLYPLPDEPVPLTTVVVAKHLTSGALLVGRFAKT
jgi:hypothetical protein